MVQTCILRKDFSEEDRRTGGGRLEVRRSRRGSPCLLCTSFDIPSHLLEAVTGYEGSHKCLVETRSSRSQPSWGRRDQIPRTCSPLKSRLPLKSIHIFNFLFTNQCQTPVRYISSIGSRTALALHSSVDICFPQK